MPYNELTRVLLETRSETLTEDQTLAIHTLVDYLEEPSPYALFLLRGYAGTGKTYLLRSITEAALRVGLRVELMASTGRAAKVLTAAVGHQATTIHRTIYRATRAMQEEGGNFQLATSSSKSPSVWVGESP